MSSFIITSINLWCSKSNSLVSILLMGLMEVPAVATEGNVCRAHCFLSALHWHYKQDDTCAQKQSSLRVEPFSYVYS